MTYEILQSGSRGNCTLINACAALDMGVSWRRLEPRAGALRLVLLTHAHADHFYAPTVRRLARERPGLRWACCPWMEEKLRCCGVDARAIDVFEPGRLYLCPEAGLKCMAEKIPHNVPNCAWHLFGAAEGDALFYATDCASLEGVEARGYGVYLVEANHTEEEIARALAEARAKGTYTYRGEAAKNHLSREQAGAWLEEMMGPGSVWVPMHRHVERKGE